ncbi:hypothetical protein THAOC_17949 [Thalassiosira oceanica]|uniref:RING-type domain-containing protein n=1 Tax=Thalassiosira oceanica TaxID=159749 RepID=K0S606_THAOC|nr:hypothetical protein THAOC_17949 [Thalassiosira oceanica]|eukprot:EJK61543.1 hypothetical protein THAOC_17949 [Thalassiosira oceanica]
MWRSGRVQRSENGAAFSLDGVRPRISFVSAIGRFINEAAEPPRFPSRGVSSLDDDGSAGPIPPPIENQRMPREMPRISEGGDNEFSHPLHDSVEEMIMWGVPTRQHAFRSTYDSDSSISSVSIPAALDGSSSDEEVAVAPVAVNEDGVPDDLICSICMALPVDPVLTPGDYMFCRTCIRTSLRRKEECPVTRRYCPAGSLRSPEGFVRRLWSSVQVKCGHHRQGCAWTGSVADYPAHLEKCTVTSNHYPAHLESARQPDQVQVKDLTSELRTAKEAHRKALEKIKLLERNNAELVRSLHKAIHHCK